MKKPIDSFYAQKCKSFSGEDDVITDGMYQVPYFPFTDEELEKVFRLWDLRHSGAEEGSLEMMDIICDALGIPKDDIPF